MVHLSRLAEELVVWSSQEFGFVRLGDDYTSGSSIMPQKRNPDVAELARGKTGRVYGNLVGALTMLKGLPLAYNRDLQEDKQGFFDTVDTLLGTLPVFAGMVATMEVNRERMREAAGDASMLATDLADYLVSKGEPFRAAHGIVAELVRHAESQGVSLSELALSEYRRFSPASTRTSTTSVRRAPLPPGTCPAAPRRAGSRRRCAKRTACWRQTCESASAEGHHQPRQPTGRRAKRY